MLCIPRTADWGGFKIGVDNKEPNIPPFEMVKVPPCISSIDNLPSLAFSEYSVIFNSISAIERFPASLTTGTTRPLSVETATPIS